MNFMKSKLNSNNKFILAETICYKINLIIKLCINLIAIKEKHIIL